MKLALLSDVHANLVALEAVVADIEARGGADGFLVLGDLVAHGYDPVGVLQRLASLPNIRFVRGNTDRHLAEDRLAMLWERSLVGEDGFEVAIEMAHSYGWTQGLLTGAGWLQWLATLALEYRMTLPDGSSLLGVHAAPGTDEGPGLRPTHNEDELRALIGGCDAHVLVVGHTHWPLDRIVDGVRIVNVGSVSNPFPPDLRACYASMCPFSAWITIAPA
jgi:predicted phosphodiesterase